MLNHILVAVDKSATSHQAFATALGLAQALGAKLTLVHALDVFDPASPERPTVPGDSYSVELNNILRENYEHQWTEFVSQYDSLLQQKQKEAEAAGVVVSHLQPYGRPGPAICKAAKNNRADLIVVGSHGHSGLRELILGSVSNYIMHHAPCSVLVIHPDRHHHHPPLEESAEPNPVEMLR
ncbi:MAG: universal stress protein [Leptolyngbya sp. SIO1E4]|nr:universal stress protein [Leptolyngbya sp. SIO1E4]